IFRHRPNMGEAPRRGKGAPTTSTHKPDWPNWAAAGSVMRPLALTSQRQPAMKCVRPLAGEIAKNPIAAGFEPLVGGAQVEHQGDAAAAALQFTNVVGGDRMKPDHPRMEPIWTMRVILENVGYEMRETACDGFGCRRAHQRGGQQELAAVAWQHGEPSDL